MKPRAFDARRRFMPDDVLMELPTLATQSGNHVERQRIQLPVQQDRTHDNGEEASGTGYPMHFAKDAGEPVQVGFVILKALPVGTGTIEASAVFGVDVIINGVPVRGRSYRQGDGLVFDFGHGHAIAYVQAGPGRAKQGFAFESKTGSRGHVGS